MTNVVATSAPAEHAGESMPRLVKMRRFGAGEGSTLPISLVSGAVILAVWWIVTDLRLVPHLFLPTPREVASAAVSVFRMATPTPPSSSTSGRASCASSPRRRSPSCWERRSVS